MEVKFKKIKEGAIIPSKATKGSAAYDLYVPQDVVVESGRFIIPLGFAMEMPLDVEALIDPRSGFSAKGMEGHKIMQLQSLDIDEPFISQLPHRFDCDVIEGKIDSDYRNEVGVIVYNKSSRFLLKKGTRIAQMTFHKVESPEWKEVEELSESKREGGFGSTGTK